MRTSTAIGAHSLVGLAQAAAVVPSMGMNPAIPWWGELLIQIGLIFGQGVLARWNSNSDQNGNTLPPVSH